MQPIQASLLPLQFSVDGVTWKDMVCLTQFNIPLATTATKTETLHCGISVGLGAIDFSPTGTAVCEKVPTGAQITYDQTVQWQVSKTLVWFKVQYPSPGSTSTNVFLSGQGYFVNTDLQANTNDVLKFTFTFNGVGEVDVVAP